MARDNRCIYCEQSIGAQDGAEHLYPAALGCRRKHRGILCKLCNGRFSVMDQELSEQLSELNGLIGVRHDRKDEPAKARIHHSDGMEYLIDSAGRAKQTAPRVLFEGDFNGERQIRVAFGDETQRQQWMEQYRQQGKTLGSTYQGRTPRYWTDPLDVRISFGGDQTLREIGRIALNFLAWKFPSIARQSSLGDFKKYVLGEKQLSLVQIDYNWNPARFIPNSYPFGHRFILVIDGEAGYAYGRVSFYSAFDLAVRFGDIRSEESTTLLIDVDPLAEHPPDDLKIYQHPGVALESITPSQNQPEDARLKLGDAFAELVRKIGDRHWEASGAQLVPALNALRSLPRMARHEQIAGVLRGNSQRIFNLVRLLVDNLRRQSRDDPAFSLIADGVEFFIQSDPASFSGVTESAMKGLTLLSYTLAEPINEILDASNITSTQLRQYLEGKDGIRIIARAILPVIGREVANLFGNGIVQ